MQDDVRGWSRIHRHQIGHLGIVSKMERIESTLHHLMNDVGVHPEAAASQAPPPALGAPLPLPPAAPTAPQR
ncbi:MAG: hypothetical protein KDA45_10230 [Planctomycetales bacterium]|nr:hypothetical protein [Planctomycetales bacterium]